LTERADQGESEMDRDCRSEIEVETEDDVCCRDQTTTWEVQADAGRRRAAQVNSKAGKVGLQ